MANVNITPSPVLPLPPLEYDVQYMNALVRILNYYIEQQGNPGTIRGTTIALSALPTSATGLASGQVWNNANVLNIIP
jgi:hypothetical protein